MITSNANKQIKWVRALQSKRRARQEDQAYVIEGTRLLEESLLSGRRPRLVLYTPEWEKRFSQHLIQLETSGVQLEAVSEAVLSSCSDVESPQGVLAIMSIEAPDPSKGKDIILILDRLADPGNLGTILRTALAANIGTVYLTPGTVDPYNPKVVRAGMGAHFYIAVQEASFDQIIEHVSGLALWTAEALAGEVYHRIDWRKPIALVIGSEAHGIHPSIQARAAGQVHIPIATHSESLNAATAAAILLFEIQRQRGN